MSKFLRKSSNYLKKNKIGSPRVLSTGTSGRWGMDFLIGIEALPIIYSSNQ